jgi:hypothetical protein
MKRGRAAARMEIVKGRRGAARGGNTVPVAAACGGRCRRAVASWRVISAPTC